MRVQATAISSLWMVLSLIAPAHADVWDANDDQTSKPHDLTQGSDEAHDLAARPGPVADVDWSRVPQDAYSSYEVLIDGLTSQAENIELTRFDASGASLLQTAAAPNVAGGASRVLEWKNGSAPGFGLIRVQGAACGATCGKDAVYRIRAVETTIAVPRFNNVGGQTTVLLIQNTRPTARSVTVYFWTSLGTLLSASTSTFSIAAHGLTVMNTTIVAPNASGSITVAHDAGHGGLAVKATTMEPATGFSFDTVGTYKAR